MHLAADLHLHSRFSDGVSKDMTFENIAIWALRKGLDLLGTGDCLHEEWLREVAASTIPAEPGMLTLNAETQRRVWARVPEKLRRPLRFVFSTEVNCQPPPKGTFEGIHHLLYFPSAEKARAFRASLTGHGHLDEGRPTVNLTSMQLLDRLMDQGDDCHFAPAHIINPWFSALGTIAGETALDELFPDHVWRLLAIETGLTSNPPMCRRVSSLDRLSTFSCSDAHSLEKIAREYTVVDIEPSYDALFSALRDGSTERIVQTIKTPLLRTKYYFNWCSGCQKPHDATQCPKCGQRLVAGARDRLERIADRRREEIVATAPRFQELMTLSDVVASLIQTRGGTQTAATLCDHLREHVGHERYVLTEASEAEISRVATSSVARAILAQRGAPTEFFRPSRQNEALGDASQQSFDFN